MNPSMIPVAALAAMEMATNRALALDPDTMDRLRGLEGKVIAVAVCLGDGEAPGTGFELELFVLPTAGGVRLMDRFDGQVDAVISGPPLSLLRLLTSDASTGSVHVRGDTELAQRFRRVLASLDIDWEEHLSNYTGDIAAHQAGNLVRGFRRWVEQSVDTLRQDAADYIREEQEIVPHRAEIERWMRDVDALRNDVERLSARIGNIGRPPSR